MGSLQQIETAAQGIVEICQKDRATKADKERLLKLQAEIFTGIEGLVECEVCGAITDLIVTMTLEEITAKICRACGIKALEAGKIQKPTPRSRTRKKKAQTTPSTKKTTKQVESSKSASTEPSTLAPPKAVPTAKKKSPDSSADTAELYANVEEQTGLKKTEVKRLHKIIEEIASPMNFEHTIVYVTHEAELAKMKLEPEVLREAVKLLMED